MAVLAWIAAAGAVAGANDRTDPAAVAPEGSGEIVVTGERAPRALRKMQSSVAVVTAADLKTHAAPDRLEQLLDLIPNVQVASGGDGPTIRGQDTTGPTRDLPAFLGGVRPRTTLIVDGRVVGFHEFIFGAASVWDLERLEVFRTPQTTTQGRNSIAGAIFLHTNDPSFAWEGRAQAIAGNYRTHHLSGVVSGPLIEDQLALRLAGDTRKARSSSEIKDLVSGANPNRDDYHQLRFKLLAQPQALPGSRVELIYAHAQSHMPQVEGVRPPFRKRRDPLDGYGTFRIKARSLTAAIGYNPVQAFSTNAVLTFGDARIARFAPVGFGETEIRNRDWSAEAVARWAPPAGRLEATGGVSHTHAKLDQFIDLSVLSGIGEFDDRQDSTGVFGEVSWRPLARGTLSFGLRYQRDRQVRIGFLQGRASAIDLAFVESFDAWLPKFSFAYDVSRQLTVGALVQRAYNPGGVSLRFDIAAPDPYEAETLWNHELFARASLVGGALFATANLFRYDIRDAQRSRPIPIRTPRGPVIGFADLFNVPRARTHGAEAALEWHASHRLSARAAVGLLDTKITRTEEATRHLLGKEFQRAPRFSGSLALDWRATERVRLSAQLRHNSGYFSDDRETPLLRVGKVTTVNTRAAMDVGPATFFAYARNLFDQFEMRHLAVTDFGAPGFGIANEPREVGIGLDARF